MEVLRQFREQEEALDNIKDSKKKFKAYFERYSIEFTIIAVIVVSGLNYVCGRIQNKNHARRWLDAVRQILIDNFAKIGSEVI